MADTAKLKEVSWQIFDMLKRDPSQYGFHFSFSPEATWTAGTKALVLTLNPQAKGPEGKPVPKIPETPWPKKHDFFDPMNDFMIKKDLQLLLRELALKDPAFCHSSLPEDDALAEFACSKAVMASFVPYRTTGSGKIKSTMWNFARDNYWGPLMRVWSPEIIILVGGSFNKMEAILTDLYTPEGDCLEKNPQEFTQCKWREYKRVSVYRIRNFRTKSGNMKLIGLPHPKAHEKTGWPTKDCPPEVAPVFGFVREALSGFSF